MVKYARSNFMTPIPAAASVDDLNARLDQRSRARQAERAGRHAGTIGEWLVADLEAFRELPAVALEPCEKRADRVSSTALVIAATTTRFRSHGFQGVMVKGLVDQVVILCGGEAIARHQRSYGPGAFVFDPLHHLPLIETKPKTLDRAAPLKDSDGPGRCFPTSYFVTNQCGLDNCLAGCLRSLAGSIARFF